jgi:hypothetical protein
MCRWIQVGGSVALQYVVGSIDLWSAMLTHGEAVAGKTICHWLRRFGKHAALSAETVHCTQRLVPLPLLTNSLSPLLDSWDR